MAVVSFFSTCAESVSSMASEMLGRGVCFFSTGLSASLLRLLVRVGGGGFGPRGFLRAGAAIVNTSEFGLVVPPSDSLLEIELRLDSEYLLVTPLVRWAGLGRTTGLGFRAGLVVFVPSLLSEGGITVCSGDVCGVTVCGGRV